jgi:hypothetical protein
MAFSTSVNLPASPTIDDKKNPGLYSELLSLHNAIHSLQSYLDIYTAAKVIATATVTIRRGYLVHLTNTGTLLKAELASAATGTKQCVAFAVADVIAGAAGEFQTLGLYELTSGLTVGAPYYLSTTGGLFTVAAPAAAGNLVQQIGVAISQTSMIFRPAFNWKQL